MRLSVLERDWVLYDVGNSAFTLLATTMIPIYFNTIAGQAGMSESDYLAYWGYATAIATLLVAVLGPVFGQLSDLEGARKKIFAGFLLIGVAGTLGMAFPRSVIGFLTVYIIAKVGYQASLVFYDAMLNDVTTSDRMDAVSTKGYAWGYIGSVFPFVIALALVLKGESIGIGSQTAMTLSFFIIALWWVAFTLPLLKNYTQKNYRRESTVDLSAILPGIKKTLKDIGKNRKVLFFLLAFFCYIDGVYTIISMAVAYGASLGLSSQSLLLALLVTQLVAFPFALLFARWGGKVPAETLIKICIIGYSGIVAFAIQLDREWEFWVLAIAVGMFQGGIQALSRSYFAKIIPSEKSGEYFGIYDICGKGAAFIGTFLVSVVTQWSGSQNVGVGILLVLFLIGYYFFRMSATTETV